LKIARQRIAFRPLPAQPLRSRIRPRCHKISGGYGFPGAGRICSIRSIYAPDADFHHHCWIYLSGRSIIRYDPGNIF
jgi:hypothetical protein